eukprot:3190399-Amphidinium_carterae.1
MLGSCERSWYVASPMLVDLFGPFAWVFWKVMEELTDQSAPPVRLLDSDLEAHSDSIQKPSPTKNHDFSRSPVVPDRHASR